MIGFVSLIGAGPGVPELLTRKAAARLRRADLVLFDALVDRRVLRLARRAELTCVGKRRGRAAISQDRIHERMIAAAREGRRVVRLKGGDPFVFGRGGEEALALRAAGIPFEIVPGVTSAVAAPAAAGIPVTHRGVAAGFVVVSGHDAQGFAEAIAGLCPHAFTLVVLMAVARRAAVADALIARGWDPSTPAALVLSAWTRDASVWRGRLASLGAAPAEAAAAGTIVIGEVAGLDARSRAEPLPEARFTGIRR